MVRSKYALMTASFVAAMAFAAPAHAAPQFLRWTQEAQIAGDFDAILKKVNEEADLALTAKDFSLGEDRQLATSRYRRYDQVFGGRVVRDMAIRVWTDKKTGRVLQAEANVQDSSSWNLRKVREAASRFANTDVVAIARRAQTPGQDPTHWVESSQEMWQDGRLVRLVSFKGKRGRHEVTLDAVTGTVLSRTYKPFPDADPTPPAEVSVPALVYPFYEEYKGEVLPRRRVSLKFLRTQAKASQDNPFATIQDREYLGSLENPIKASTQQGRNEGYWSFEALVATARDLGSAVPYRPNEFDKGGALLQGRYVSINIHPDALDRVPEGTLPKVYAPFATFDYREKDDDFLVIPRSPLVGHVWASPGDILNAPATRDPNHDMATYIRNGFDEIQVYYAVNQMFTALRARGWTDADLSTRPFQAFLFNPDIEMRDNAFYNADTINFTTYSPDAINNARDNLTIWHELGHGVMDRMMGTKLNLADTGGLSEGMADFVEEMVLQSLSPDAVFPGSRDRRIINRIGFFLTNEVHDDGEAYGGTMRAILEQARARDGAKGVAQVVDLTLEAMRLSRDHPHLTAQDWFERVLYADALGHEGVREPGALRAMIEQALNARNFAASGDRAQLTLKYNGREVLAGQPGSRGNGIPSDLGADETRDFPLSITIADGKDFKFVYPVRVRLSFNGGPLQGAVHWVGEESGTKDIVVSQSGETVEATVSAAGKCDYVNREDGGCQDFVYVQAWNAGEDSPVAKKRFYVRVKTKNP